MELLTAVDELVETFDVGTGEGIVADDHEHLEVAANAPELGVTEALQHPWVAQSATRDVTYDDSVAGASCWRRRCHVPDVAEDRCIDPAAPPQFAHNGQAGVGADRKESRTPYDSSR